MDADQEFHLRDQEQLLRTVKNVSGDNYIYDFGYVVQLFASLLDNLQKNALEAEIEEIAYRFNDDQRNFLMHLAQAANLKTDQQIDEEDDLP
jgi:hypothetical protein